MKTALKLCNTGKQEAYRTKVQNDRGPKWARTEVDVCCRPILWS